MEKKYSEIEQKVIAALGQWDSEDWIISCLKSIDGSISFYIHIQTKSLDCSNIIVQEIEMDGNWIRIRGKLTQLA